MRLGLDIAQHRVSFDEVINRARLGERLGFTGVWGFDHFKPMYGQGPGECFEGMTTLAALAGVTSTVRLGLLVTGVTYRHPSVLACQAITVDHASHGRLDLALGAGWAQEEHDELGIEFPRTGQRFDLLEDTLEIVTRLFTGEQVSYQGRRLSLRNAQCGQYRFSHLDHPSGSAAADRRGRCPLWPGTPTCGTLTSTPTIPNCRGASTTWLGRKAAIRPTSVGPGRSRCPSRGPRCAPPSSATSIEGSVISCAAGRVREPIG